MLCWVCKSISTVYACIVVSLGGVRVYFCADCESSRFSSRFSVSKGSLMFYSLCLSNKNGYYQVAELCIEQRPK